MILCRDKTDAGGGVVGEGGRHSLGKYIGWLEERVRRFKNKCVTISNRY